MTDGLSDSRRRRSVVVRHVPAKPGGLGSRRSVRSSSQDLRRSRVCGDDKSAHRRLEKAVLQPGDGTGVTAGRAPSIGIVPGPVLERHRDGRDCVAMGRQPLALHLLHYPRQRGDRRRGAASMRAMLSRARSGNVSVHFSATIQDVYSTRLSCELLTSGRHSCSDSARSTGVTHCDNP